MNKIQNLKGQVSLHLPLLVLYFFICVFFFFPHSSFAVINELYSRFLDSIIFLVYDLLLPCWLPNNQQMTYRKAMASVMQICVIV